MPPKPTPPATTAAASSDAGGITLSTQPAPTVFDAVAAEEVTYLRAQLTASLRAQSIMVAQVTQAAQAATTASIARWPLGIISPASISQHLADWWPIGHYRPFENSQ
jgi:hypothetical protein